MQKKRMKSRSLIFIVLLVAVFSISFASAGFTDVLKQILGIGDSDLSGELGTLSPTPYSPPTYTCTETDNGIDYYTQGYTTGILGGTSSDYVSYYDTCLVGRTTYYVKEYYCSNNQVYSTTYACENCQNGACVEETYECYSDSDCNYMDTECAEGVCQAGYCNYSYSSSTHICRESAGECDGIEYCTGYSPYCPVNIYKPEGTPCSGGQCQNGACVWVNQDTIPPSIFITSLGGDTTSPYTTSDSTPIILFTTNEEATCRISTDGDESYTQMSDDIQCNSGNLTHACQLPFTPDSTRVISIYISCKDNAGNENTPTNNLNEYYLVDTQPPIQSSHNPPSGSKINTTTITIRVDTDEDAKCRVSTDGDESYTQMSDDTQCSTIYSSNAYSSNHSCTIAGLSQGLNYIYIACQDDTEAYPNQDTQSTNTMIIYNLTTQTPGSCTDSDGGKNYFVQGTGPDYCIGNILREHYCNNGFLDSINYSCSNIGMACLDGMCMNQTSSAVITSCKDTDSGKDYFESGIAGYNIFEITVEPEDPAIVSVDKQDHIIELVTTLSSTSAKISVDGTEKTLSRGSNSLYSGNIALYVKEIQHPSFSGDYRAVDLVIGNSSFFLSKPDYCLGNVVKETYCNNGIVDSISYSCSDRGMACEDGACVTNESQNSRDSPCLEVDGGKDYSYKGGAISRSDLIFVNLTSESPKTVVINDNTTHIIELITTTSSTSAKISVDGIARPVSENTYVFPGEIYVDVEYINHPAYQGDIRNVGLFMGKGEEDYCLGNNVREFYCNNGIVDFIDYSCSDRGMVCQNGACAEGLGEVPSTIVTSCNDTDGGINYYTPGTVFSGSAYTSDYCHETNTNVLFEFYCENGKISGRNQTCTAGCQNGACLNESRQTPFCGDKICQGATSFNMTQGTALNYTYNNKNYFIYLMNTTNIYLTNTTSLGSAEFYINNQQITINEREQKIIEGLPITLHQVDYKWGVISLTLGESEYTCPEDCRKWYGSISGITTTIVQVPVNILRFLTQLLRLE